MKSSQNFAVVGSQLSLSRYLGLVRVPLGELLGRDLADLLQLVLEVRV